MLFVVPQKADKCILRLIDQVFVLKHLFLYDGFDVFIVTLCIRHNLVTLKLDHFAFKKGYIAAFVLV